MFFPFDYYDPKTFSEFISLSKNMIERKEPFRILAGGTDLLIQLRNGWKPCPNIVDIKKIQDRPDLFEIKELENGIHLGSLVDFTAIKENKIICQKFTALHASSSVMGCYEIRNRATIGGNIGTASSGAEGTSPLIAFDATVHIDGIEGKREALLLDIYQIIADKPGIALEPGEIITHLFLPYLPDNTQSLYMRRARTKGMDVAGMNLSLVVCHSHLPKDRIVRICGGAVAPLPIRFTEVEKLLSHKEFSRELIEEAKKMLKDQCNPRASSKRASPEYKKDQIGYFLELGLEKMGLLERKAE